MALAPPHFDLYYTRLIQHELPERFTADAPEVAQFLYPVMAFESRSA